MIPWWWTAITLVLGGIAGFFFAVLCWVMGEEEDDE